MQGANQRCLLFQVAQRALVWCGALRCARVYACGACAWPCVSEASRKAVSVRHIHTKRSVPASKKRMRRNSARHNRQGRGGSHGGWRVQCSAGGCAGAPSLLVLFPAHFLISSRTAGWSCVCVSRVGTTLAAASFTFAINSCSARGVRPRKDNFGSSETAAVALRSWVGDAGISMMSVLAVFVMPCWFVLAMLVVLV